MAEPFILLAAANRAIHQAAHNRMYTRSLSAELIYSLSPTRNVSVGMCGWDFHCHCLGRNWTQPGTVAIGSSLAVIGTDLGERPDELGGSQGGSQICKIRIIIIKIS